jgi:hypothetical protein
MRPGPTCDKSETHRNPPLRSLALLSALAGLGCAASQLHSGQGPGDGWQITSPDGRLRVLMRLRDLGGTADFPEGKRLYYWAEYGEPGGTRAPVLEPSPLGIRREDQAFVDDLTFKKVRKAEVREEYTMLRGKRSRCANQGTERVFTFTNQNNARVDITFRVFNDGFAFRYQFPDNKAGRFTIASEETGFHLPSGGVGFLAPHDRRHNQRPDYESVWQAEVPVGAASPSESGWTFPALFRAGEAGPWLLLSESGLDAGYSATHLGQAAVGGVYRIAFPDAREVDGQWDAMPSSSLPWSTPWRVVMVGDRLASIVESTLVTDLAPPSAVQDTGWIRPGRASWSWWSDGGSPRVFSKVVPFIDLAADMGWEYSLVDSGWSRMEGGSWQELVGLAHKRGVGLMFWYHSGVPHANTAGRNTMLIPEQRKQEMRRIAAAGVTGIKVDFFDSDKQQVIKHYLGMLEDAAQSHLLVNFHGSTLPRGWDRTYPNLMSMEGVRGAEGYGSDTAFGEKGPAHNTVLAFTRNVVGPMDYTPVAFSNKKVAHRTTYAHELALSVVFESGIQHFPDKVESYRGLPGDVQTFLRFVPVAWDDTRFIDGEPGKLVVLARRKGSAWYVAGINGEKQEKLVSVKLDFMAEGPSGSSGPYHAQVISDGTSDTTFSTGHSLQKGGQPLSITLRPFGGFVARLMPSL